MDEDDALDGTNVKSRTSYRWPVLAGVNMMMFGCYYCYDNPAALNNYFTENTNSTPSTMPRLTATQFNGLYSAYSFPNTILPFFGGILVDKLGCRKMILIFSCCLRDLDQFLPHHARRACCLWLWWGIAMRGRTDDAGRLVHGPRDG
jgi:MFS family permease